MRKNKKELGTFKKKVGECWENNKEYFFYLLFIFFVSIIICMLFGQEMKPDTIKHTVIGEDDQRSTLWPIMVSLAATLLGSLITTYVFLKGALDRTIDEKSYYDSVIKEYRDSIMKFLWILSVVSLLLMAFVFLLYFMFYFLNRRVLTLLRGVVIIAYGAILYFSAVFLYKCININKGIQKAADKLLSVKKREGRELLGGIKKEELYDAIEESLETWLQISDGVSSGIIDKSKFISRFSDWEKILLLLIEEEKLNDGRSIYEKIKLAVLDGEKVFADTTIEEDDAEAYGWEDRAYADVEEYQEKLDISGEEFCHIYAILSEYRNLMKVQLEIGDETGKRVCSCIEEDGHIIAELFFVFLIYLWVNILRTLPKVTVFFPAGKFLYVNFYNTRFENSAFRASYFENEIFSRSKVDNSNFGMAFFKNCEFFSADCRNCSFSNVKIEFGRLNEAIFENVDFTGTVFENCSIERTVFREVILSNLTISETTLKQSELVNSKIGNVILKIDAKDDGQVCGDFFDINNCNFSNSSLDKIQVYVGKRHWGLSGNRTADPIISRYLEILGKDYVNECFWGEGNHDFGKIERFIEDFRVNGAFFQNLRIKGKEIEKKEEREKPIWKRIKEEVRIHMNENIFVNTSMPGIKFFRVSLEQGIFENAQMEAVRFISVYMPGCIMTCANMRDGFLWAVNMRSAVLDEAILFKAKCCLVNMEDASLRHLHASGARVVYCTFNRSDCSHIDLTRAVLQESSFADTILKKAEFTNAQFLEINFENSIADEMLSSYSLFKRCNMKNAFLEQSNFNYTVFNSCDFSYADFANSAAINVAFYHCDFKDSNFRNTCFINAYFEENDNIIPEIFEGCQFINPIFKGKNKKLNQILEKYIVVK